MSKYSSPLSISNDLKVDIDLIEKLILEELGQDFLSKILKPLVRAKSKRLRPALMFLANQNTKNKKQIIVAASALEMLHIASLIHDDIMDEASKRRGLKTINKIYGNEQAILAGDYLFTKSYMKLSKLNPEMTSIMMHSFLNICRGQSLELKDSFNLKRTLASYLKSIELKTAELFACSLEIVARINKYSPQDIKKFREFGLNFGLLFQIIDDLSDYFSNQKILSKPTFNDLKEGNYSYPIIIALKKEKTRTTQYLNDPKLNKTKIINHLIKIGALNKSLELAYKYMTKAQKSLDNLSSKNDDIEKLKAFPKDYLIWSINNLFLKKYRIDSIKILEGLDKGI